MFNVENAYTDSHLEDDHVDMCVGFESSSLFKCKSPTEYLLEQCILLLNIPSFL